MMCLARISFISSFLFLQVLKLPGINFVWIAGESRKRYFYSLKLYFWNRRSFLKLTLKALSQPCQVNFFLESSLVPKINFESPESALTGQTYLFAFILHRDISQISISCQTDDLMANVIGLCKS